MPMNISTKLHACIRMCMIIVTSRSTNNQLAGKSLSHMQTFGYHGKKRLKYVIITCVYENLERKHKVGEELIINVKINRNMTISV